MCWNIFDLIARVFVICLFLVLATGKSLQDVRAYEPGAETALTFAAALAREGLEMDCGYVRTRRGVAMFWWLWYAGGRRAGAAGKPLVAWVQGGPGLPASGIGNFLEIGPLDMHFRRRNHSWVNEHNLLLVDSPAGTGFSRVDRDILMATRDKQVVTDFVKTLAGFLEVHPEYKRTAWHIFSQSYGGKLAPKIGYRLFKAIRKGTIEMDLRTVAIGSGFVDPSESISSSADYLYHVGLLDIADYEKHKKATDDIVNSIRAKVFLEAFVKNMNKYNGIPHILDVNKNNVNAEYDGPLFYKLESIVNDQVKPALNATRSRNEKWECFSNQIYVSLRENVMMSSKKYVEKLLNETSIKVVVYNGNFDAVTPMAGCVNWVHSLRWSGAEEFRKKNREPIAGERNGYRKQMGNLSLWWVLGSGHWVPNDNPAAMQDILNFATSERN